jgi:hypothetical protein
LVSTSKRRNGGHPPSIKDSFRILNIKEALIIRFQASLTLIKLAIFNKKALRIGGQGRARCLGDVPKREKAGPKTRLSVK